MKRLAALLIAMLLPAAALAYTGTGGLWIQKKGDFTQKNRSGDASGLSSADAYITPTGLGILGPGLEALSIPSYRAGVCWIRNGYAANQGYGPPWEWYPRQVRQIRVDSVGVHADSTLITPRLGPPSTYNSGGAVRIIEGTKFPFTIAGVQAANDELKLVGGGEVWVPSNANILVGTTPLKLSNKVTLRGFAQYNANPTFVCNASTNVPFVIGAEDTTGGQEYFGVENIEIDGKKSTGARVDVGIKARKIFVGTKFRDVLVHDVSGNGFRIGGDNITATGQLVMDNCIVLNTNAGGILLDAGIRSIWLEGCTVERPGRNTWCLKVDGTTTTSAQNIGVGIDHFYTEITDSMSSGIVVDGASSVQINNYVASRPSGRFRSAVQIRNSVPGNNGLAPSGVVIQSLYAESDTLIEDIQNSRIITVGGDVNNAYKFVNWWTPTDNNGGSSTDGYRNSGQIIGMQDARIGPQIASAATVTPHPAGGHIFKFTGTTTSTDVVFWDSFIGKYVTFWFTTAMQVTSGNHWKLNGNFVANGTGNDDTLTGFVDDSKNFREISRAIP